MESIPVGGQAVIEGVMMRSPQCFAVAVRTPKGRILVRKRRWISLAAKWKFLRWPFLRGVLVLGESLHNGMSALSFSARVQEETVGAKESPASLWLTMGFAVLLALGLFAALPHFLTWAVGALAGAEALTGGRSLSFHLVDGAIKLAIFVGYIGGISLMPDVKKVFMYHGAEHQSIHAHEKGEELSVDMARAHPRLHPRCGTAFILLVLLVAVVAFSLVFPFIPPISGLAFANQSFFVLVKLVLLFPIAGLSYEVVRLAGKHPEHWLLRHVISPGLALQKLTTRKPTDEQLEVAIASLRTVLASERRYRAHPEEGVAETQEEYGSLEELAAAMEAGNVPEA